MALYTSKGKISDMSEVKSGTSNSGFEWERMTLTLEMPGFQGSVYYQVFQVSNEHVKEVLLFSIGDRVEISWSMYAREWNGKMYNNVDLVKIVSLDAAKQEKPAAPAPKAAPTQTTETAQESDQDLPF